VHGLTFVAARGAVDNKVPPRSYVGKFWVDSLVHDADALVHMLKVFGDQK
jgi:aminocarboxymuconate-semialdehyde decarboxylase